MKHITGGFFACAFGTKVRKPFLYAFSAEANDPKGESCFIRNHAEKRSGNNLLF